MNMCSNSVPLSGVTLSQVGLRNAARPVRCHGQVMDGMILANVVTRLNPAAANLGGSDSWPVPTNYRAVGCRALEFGSTPAVTTAL